ncbi:Uncharacterized protein OBRU01_17130 [Operophtera brumata]|uniref:Uncharacterized protein n=1 Tax=Operophtera brumata TaxID=104452 RepID=A0A0L7L170_OPEBR|nr:Uncharacterized protein OBRU01_17130 [Operophtera brumata]
MTPSPAANDESPPQYTIVGIDKAVQNKLILELAWKTVALMQKNKLIQQKIIALQKETSEFVAAIVNSPENKQRYIDYMRAQELNARIEPDRSVENKENFLKTESMT